MNKIKIFTYYIYIFLIVGLAFVGYKSHKRLTKKKALGQLYKTETPQIKTLSQNLSAAGILELKEIYKICSQVDGIVRDVLVKENDFVKKGQLLATIEILKGDKDVKIAKCVVDKAKHEYDYQKEYYKRQNQLYKSGQIAKNYFQRIEADYLKSIDDLNSAKMYLEKAELEIKNTNIIAPADGIITNVIISKSMAVLNDYQNTLIELAEDISTMKATLDIDESEVGQIKIGQLTKIIINSYPDFQVKEKIAGLSFIPKNGTPGNTQAFYKATVNLNNKYRVLRPGMRLNAQIRIAKVKDALSLRGMAFQVDPDTLQKIANQIKFDVKTIDKKTKKNFIDSNFGKVARFVWVEEGNTFIEKAIIIGVTDETYWQVISGLTKNDKVVVDVQEPNTMDDIYSKWFQGSL